MNTPKIVIRFVEAATQTTGNMTRVIGFVPSRHIFTLFDNPDVLDANPRKPKVNRVTGDIIDTLNNTPDLFQFKSKGLLIGTSSYEALQRNRYALDFYDKSSEGILDGGHNMLSMGIYFLSKVMDELALRKIKDWEELQEAWDEHRDQLEELRDEIDFLIPVELLIPSDDDPETITAFNIALIDICAARNNNAQLAEEAKANQKGFYDEIRKRMEDKTPDIAERVEWKPNEWASDSNRKIKVRDLIALCWIPLNKLAEEELLPEGSKMNPVQLYSSKGKCSEAFGELYERNGVARQMANGRYELQNSSVGSAFDILTDLPVIYDWMVTHFPATYNSNNGKFGNIGAVKTRKTLSPYCESPMDYDVPDGFVMPLFYGVISLLEVHERKLRWKVSPIKFLERWFAQILKGYKMPMEMSLFDPQKVAKNIGSYELAIKEFKFALMEEENERS
jgi:hypothetical protein